MLIYFIFAQFSLQALIFASLVSRKTDLATYITPLGNHIPKYLLMKRLRGIDESKWDDHIFEVQKTVKSLKLVGSSSSHDFIGAKISIHEPCIGKNRSNSKEVSFFIDGKRLEACNFKYLSHSIENNTRIITDESGMVISGVLRGRQLYPLNHMSKFNTFTVGRQLVSNVIEAKYTLKNAKSSKINCLKNDLPLVVELAVTFDSSLCEIFNKDEMFTFAAVSDMMYMAMVPFNFQTCIRHRIVHMSGYCDRSKDIYRSAVQTQKANHFLDVLRSSWYSKHSLFGYVKRDFVYLLIGNGPPTTRGSLKGVICNKYNGFAWSVYRYGSSQISREMGHSFGAGYDLEDGYMKRFWNIYKNLHNVKWFGEKSLKSFKIFVQSKGSCLLNGPVPDQYWLVKDHENTCENGFSVEPQFGRWRVPEERKWIDLGQKEVTMFSRSVSLFSRIYQTRTHFIMELKIGSSGYVIESYFRRPQIVHQDTPAVVLNIGPEIEIQRPTVFSYGATTIIRSQWTWTELHKPENIKTCCGNQLFLRFVLRLCELPERKCAMKTITFILKKIECVFTTE